MNSRLHNANKRDNKNIRSLFYQPTNNRLRRTRQTGHTAGEVSYKPMSDVLQWTTTHRHTRDNKPAKTDIQHLCTDTECRLANFTRMIADREEKKRERDRERIKKIIFTHLKNNDNNPIHQPLCSGRIWQKVNFYAEFYRFEFRVFLLLD